MPGRGRRGRGRRRIGGLTRGRPLRTNQAYHNANEDRVPPAGEGFQCHESHLHGLESHLKGGESHLKGGESHLKGGESHLKGGESHLKRAESHFRPDESHLKPRESHLKPEESHFKLEESHSDRRECPPWPPIPVQGRRLRDTGAQSQRYRGAESEIPSFNPENGAPRAESRRRIFAAGAPFCGPPGGQRCQLGTAAAVGVAPPPVGGVLPGAAISTCGPPWRPPTSDVSTAFAQLGRCLSR